MEIVVKENVANKPMHYGPYVLGEISAPDSHYIPMLYSHYEATKDFNKLDSDIYQKQSQSKPADRKKTPKSVIYGAIVLALVTAWQLIKHALKK
ncbi:hypothetical protein IJZ97_02865 [bacterium]|nr:hypothetical protein [bacterium]